MGGTTGIDQQIQIPHYPRPVGHRVDDQVLAESIIEDIRTPGIVDMPKGATTREIELKYLEICETSFKPDLVIIDYLGIMSSNDTASSDWMDLGVISAELHEFSRVYEVATITGSQVNRTKDGTV